MEGIADAAETMRRTLALVAPKTEWLELGLADGRGEELLKSDDASWAELL